MRKSFKLIASMMILTILFAFTGCEYQSTRYVNTGKDQLTGLHHVEIEVENYGTICCELDADTAPISVTNFIELAKSGFYNGTKFHRIISGFMIQGGGALTQEDFDKVQPIHGEFSSNGTPNDISHLRGTISMARSVNDPDSATSQFFIVHQDHPDLDGDYAAFGHVTSGMEVVDKIAEDSITAPQGDNGMIDAEYQPVIKEVRVID